ncbi:MAG: S46 family peptidase, partial [Candidatus Aminicenantes bacterium]|nr:S46 family peptidase [Candidatus Aminicenantes bacterium]
DLERESAFMDRNFPQTKKRLEINLHNYHPPTDRALLKELLLRLSRLPEKDRLAPLAPLFRAADFEPAADAFCTDLYARSKAADPAYLLRALEMRPAELKALGDPALELAAALYDLSREVKKRGDTWTGTLDRLSPLLLEAKSAFQAKAFIPDANSTLRLTFGRVKGYAPRDAVLYSPFTTLDGVAEKTTGLEPFDTPPALLDLWRAGDFGRFKPEGFRSVPTCLLYDTDTTGGNSGSPVLNARGELVGVNFDRTFEATINDYAWSEDYSRSIGVDIRYVLWVTEKFAGADFLLREMNVPPSR